MSNITARSQVWESDQPRWHFRVTAYDRLTPEVQATIEAVGEYLALALDGYALDEILEGAI